MLHSFDQRHDIFERRIGLGKVTGTRQEAIRPKLLDTLTGFLRHIDRRAERQDFLILHPAMKDELVAILGL